MTGSEYRKLRKKIGSQKEVAEKLGITRQCISLREMKSKITLEAILAISYLLHHDSK